MSSAFATYVDSVRDHQSYVSVAGVAILLVVLFWVSAKIEMMWQRR